MYILLCLFSTSSNAGSITLSGSDAVLGTLRNNSTIENTTNMLTGGPPNPYWRGYVEFLLADWYVIENNGIFADNITGVVFEADRAGCSSGSWATFHAMLGGEDGQLTVSDYDVPVSSSLFTIHYPTSSTFSFSIDITYLKADINGEQISSGYNTRTTATNYSYLINPKLIITYNSAPQIEWSYIDNAFTWENGEATSLYKLWKSEDNQNSFISAIGDTWFYTDALGIGTPGSFGNTGSYKYIQITADGTGLITSSSNVVPEPATLILLLLSGLSIFIRNRS